MKRFPRPMPPHRARRGIALAEAALAVLVVAIAIGAGLQAAAASARSRQAALDQTMARQLAQALLDEICSLPYADPNQTPVFGVETGESRTPNRATLDDVDDYTAWTEPALASKGGAALAVPGRYSRRVTVSWVTRHPTPVDTTSETGLKRVVVEVSIGGKLICRLTALRSRSMDIALRRSNP
jgi:Tfp pilus assembly protein PilV